MFKKFNNKLDSLLGGPNNYSLKKKFKLGLIIGIPIFIIIIIIIVLAPSSSSGDSKIYPKYNHSTFFFLIPKQKTLVMKRIIGHHLTNQQHAIDL